MADYKFLKDKLQNEKNSLISRQDSINRMIDQYTKKEKIVAEVTRDRTAYEKIIGKLNKFFPKYNKQYEAINSLNHYLYLIKNKKLDAIDPDKIEKDLNEVFDIFNEKFPSMIKMIKKVIAAYKSMDKDSKKREKFLNNLALSNGHNLTAIFEDIYISVTDKMTLMLKELLEEQKVDNGFYKELEIIDRKLELIDQINSMFSRNSLDVEVETDEDIKSIVNIVKPFLTNDEMVLLLNRIREELEEKKEEENNVIVDFSNLDISFFNEEERNIIEELREIIEDEELEEKENPFSNIEISYEARLEHYKDASINDILLDVSVLLNNIYNHKEDVIKLFKVIIDKYKKYNLSVTRDEKIIELLKIKNDFETIVSFINKNYKDRDESYRKEKQLTSLITSIDTELIPIIKEMIDNDMDYDEFYDNEIDDKIKDYKKLIKKWKKIMSKSYRELDTIEDGREDTDNLVFCITDVDISTPGFEKEFSGTVESLESRTSHDLKKRPGRRGMSRIRKTTENGKERDFVEYLESKYKIKLHFVPYRYSSEPDYRTGLIKFEPSATVKEFLEDHYGLSKQSAYYGLFQVISAKGANHNEYAYFENYILNNFKYIEEIASLFVSDNPDLDKLVSVIDDMLLKKKNILKSIENTMN